MKKQYYQMPLTEIISLRGELMQQQLQAGSNATSGSEGDAPARRFSPTPGLGTN